MIWAVPILGYILGHFVTGFGSQLREFVAKRVSFIKTEKQICEDIARKPAYGSFVMQAVERMPWLAALPKDSLMTPDEKHTVYRFMFIPLLNLGAGTVCIILGLSWTLATLALRVPWLQPWASALFPQRRPLDISVFLAGTVLAYFFFERRKAFYPRALRAPFSMAIVKLGAENATSAPKPTGMQSPPKPVVYLAGGTHSHWQDAVIKELPGWSVIDPRSHHLGKERAYTLWDLDGVRNCDWVLANMEGTNPGGYNLAVEVGYAKALGKRIVYVDGKSGSQKEFHQHSGMLRACANIEPTTLDEAIALLKKFPVTTADKGESHPFFEEQGHSHRS